MATNYVGPGAVLNYTAGATIAAGDVVEMADTIGIALVGGVSGDVIAVAIEGVFTVAKTTGTAWVQGDNVDWDTSAGEFHVGLTPAVGDVASVGIAAAAAASGAATGQVKLLGGAAASVAT